MFKYIKLLWKDTHKTNNGFYGLGNWVEKKSFIVYS